jgi:deoxyribodipyrimidine photo-lyase
MGQALVVRQGPALEALRALANETGARAAFWNRRYEPASILRDRAVEAGLREDGLLVESGNASLLVEPWMLKPTRGKPYTVFTPFWRAVMTEVEVHAPLSRPKTIKPPRVLPASRPLSELGLEPAVDWARGIRERWSPGRAGALARLRRFEEEGVSAYEARRDLMASEGTSLLSPHLRFGEIGPREVWHAVGGKPNAHPYLRQLVWREFAYHLLHHFPRTPEEPLRDEFARFAWRPDRQALRAWERGRTGYPIVDAAMRELWTTGWMHNRARMISASFLVKHLLQPWTAGARWFWDTLVDADLANNTFGWQWVSGAGADAAPYFRIFNPILQGRKFDPDGRYVTRWLPELSRLEPAWIHAPWEAPAGVLERAGVELGRSYPQPIVEHRAARLRALSAYAAMRTGLVENR